jgi:hypothetical protein
MHMSKSEQANIKCAFPALALSRGASEIYLYAQSTLVFTGSLTLRLPDGRRDV